MKLLIVLAVVIALVAAWQMRVQLMAKVLGQSESRVQRHLGRRR